MSTTLTELELPMLDFADPEVAVNPYAAIRALEPAHWIARTPVGYLVLRYADCKEIFKDRRFRTPPGLGLAAQGITSGPVFDWASKALQGLDGEDHARIRRIAQPAFTGEQSEKIRPGARSLVNEILDEADAAGKRVDAYMMNNSYSIRVICRMLGFPEDHWQSLAEWSDAINAVVSVTGAEEIEAIGRALGELRRFTAETVDTLSKHPTDSLGSRLVAAEVEGERLTRDELLEMFESLLAAGAETVRTMLTFSALLFSKYPEQWSALRADPTLVPAAVEEILRFRPPFIGPAPRFAREDVVLNDVLIPEGTFLNLACSANFDHSVYDQPEDFDIRRFAGGDGARLRPAHFTLGYGWHSCIGAVPGSRRDARSASGHDRADAQSSTGRRGRGRDPVEHAVWHPRPVPAAHPMGLTIAIAIARAASALRRIFTVAPFGP